MPKVESNITIDRARLEKALGPLLKIGDIKLVLGHKQPYSIENEPDPVEPGSAEGELEDTEEGPLDHLIPTALKEAAELGFRYLEQCFVPDSLERFNHSHRTDWTAAKGFDLLDAVEVLKFSVAALSKITASEWAGFELTESPRGSKLEIYSHVFTALKALASDQGQAKDSGEHKAIRQLQTEFLRTIQRFRLEHSGQAPTTAVTSRALEEMARQLR